MPNRINQFVRLLRIKHWLKNILVFLPLIFSGQLLSTDYSTLFLSIGAFFSFSFMASAIYIINDINDIEVDSKHPKKKFRPIASGEINVNQAILILILLIVASVCICLPALNIFLSLFLLIIYGIINIAYSFGLKSIPIIDICILASGFFIRVLFGGYYYGINVSPWMSLSILSLALFFSLGKRRGELKLHGSEMRMSLRGTTVDFFDKTMYVFLGAGVIFYSLWLSERLSIMNETLIPLAIAFCFITTILICLRYTFLIEQDISDGDPIEVIYSDKVLMIYVVIWALINGSIIYINV